MFNDVFLFLVQIVKTNQS